MNNFDKIILHCDMNNFFASVECMLNPSIKDKPVAVCGNQKERHGIVLAKNYYAKPYGISVGDTVWKAKQKCPELVIVDTPHYSEYKKYSKKAFDIYRRWTDRVEPFGIDEAWMDITASMKLFDGNEIEFADNLRKCIRDELGLTISVGVSFNKAFAKLGSDLKKPDATTYISVDNYKKLIWPLPTYSLLGVGKNTKKLLDKYYIKTIGDIANENLETLKYRFGKSGEILYKYANGLDDSEVAKYDDWKQEKSISHGTTTSDDMTNNDEVWKVILKLTDDVAYKLRRDKLRANGIVVYVKKNNLAVEQYRARLEVSEQSAINIAKKAFDLFNQKYDWDKPVRAITIGVTNLVNENEPQQMSIFYDIDKRDKMEKMEKCIEKINQKYGKKTVVNATLLKVP